MVDFRQQFIGADFSGTSGIKVGVNSNPDCVPARSELTAAIAALESAYQAADTAINSDVAGQIADLTGQIQTISLGIRKKTVVAARYVGTISSLDGANGFFQGIGFNPPTAIGSAGEPETAEDMLASAVLVISPTAGESGIYYRSNDGNSNYPWVRHSAFYEGADLLAGTLIYVDGGDSANTFWLVADTTTSNVVNIIPFGQAQDLSVGSGSSLSIVANELNQSLDGDYFVVNSGALSLSTAFLSRISDLEQEVLTLESDFSTLNSSVGTLTSTVNGLQTDTAANTSAISDLQTAVSGVITIAAVKALMASMEKRLPLTSGSFASGVTTFYVSTGWATADFEAGWIRRINTPIEYQGVVDITIVDDPSDGTKKAAKVEMQGATQIADDTYNIYLKLTDPYSA